MASSRYLAENVVDALFDDDFGLSDEDNSEDSEDDYIHGYLGSSFFTAAEPGDQELQPDEELADNEVESVEIGEDEVEKSAVNEENIIDEARLPVIYEDENLADAVHSAERSADDRSSDNLDGTSDGLQVPVTLDGEVLRIAGSPTIDTSLGESSHLEDTVTSDPVSRETDPSNSDCPSSPSIRAVTYTGNGSTDGTTTRGRGRGTTRGRGRGTTRGRGRGTTRGRGRGTTRGRGRGTTRGRGRGTARGRGRGGTSATSDTDHALPEVAGTWEADEEPQSVLYRYREIPGSTVPFDDDTTAVSLFYRYFTDEVWNLLVTETNRYAQANLSSMPNARAWTDVTIEEMKAFIGITILMGIIQLPRFDMYWQTSNPLITTSGVSSIMSRIRFQQIFRYLHLADNAHQIPADQPGHDKLYKVRNLLDILSRQFQSNYTPTEYITIDEAMIPFKGRLGFKQYMKDKPTKWGIKVFTLSDATNAYVYRLQVYTGKNLESGSVNVGLSSRVCIELMSGLPEGLKLFTDNYYTSPRLYKALYEKGYNCCGTVRTHRKDFPSDLVITKNMKVSRGYIDYRSNGPLLAVAWYDRRNVYFLSTMHRAELDVNVTVKRKNPDGTRADVTCPPLLPDYQQYMRGVDRGDQLVTYYNLSRRSKKWWKRCFAHLVECSLLNAYVLDGLAFPQLHAQKGSKKRDFLSFRLDVAMGLVSSFHSRKRTGRPRSGEYSDIQRMDLQRGHWPVGTKRKAECVVCSKKRAKLHLQRSDCRHESRVICSYCDVHLCIDEDRKCFMKYHTDIQYWL